jgi:hypothetical protein
LRLFAVRRCRTIFLTCLDPLPDSVDIKRPIDPEGSWERPSSQGEFKALWPRMQVRPSSSSPALLVGDDMRRTFDDQT